MPARKIARYGWIRDLPRRDATYRFAAPNVELPTHVDLRPQCPPVYDQGQVGSCTGNATAGALQFDRRKQGLPDWVPSRLFAYFNGRLAEGTTGSDSGAQISDVIDGVTEYGDCPETEWPYDVGQVSTQPPAQCYTDAVKYKVVQKWAVPQSLQDTRDCLASGFPFVFDFVVHRDFESQSVAQTGVLGIPGWFDPVVGGHAVLAVGYDDDTRVFIVRNSWGDQWGQAGYFTMPYDYLLSSDLASDLWVIRVVAG